MLTPEYLRDGSTTFRTHHSKPPAIPRAAAVLPRAAAVLPPVIRFCRRFRLLQPTQHC